MLEQTETIDTADGPMGVHIVRPEGDGPFPVVVYFHHGPGLDDGSKQSMARIADWGYYVISHDRYHRDQEWLVADRARMAEDEELRNRFWEVLMGTTDEMVATDLDAVLAFLESDPAAREAPMGCIGFCIGARSVMRTLRDHNDIFRAGVGLHPSYCTTDDPDSPHLCVPDLEGSLYIGFGAEDKAQSVADNQAFIDSVAARGEGFEVEIHKGADHGFAVPGRAYHEAAGDRSYERAEALFDEELT
jgi:carboxymethylenebutenolidase